MKIISAVIFLMALAACLVQAQQPEMGVVDRPENLRAEPRIALVIGNSDYKEAPLLNPVNDVRDMAQALSALGFEVMHKENLTQNEMKSAIRAFGERIRKGGVGLFYYAGHGVQVNGENYLIPVGAVITKEEEIEYEAINIGLVLAQTANARNRLNIIILDACRNNPFVRDFRSIERGLAVMSASSGTIIGFATAPGKIASDGSGRNGLYTQELLHVLKVKGIRIEEFFKRVRVGVIAKSNGKQVPWENSSLVEDFYFKEPDGTVIEGTDASSTLEALEKPVVVESVKGTIWLEDGRVSEGKSYFIEFLPEGRIKRHHGLNDNSYVIINVEWYQTDNILHVIWYEEPAKKNVQYQYEGTIKGNRIEGTWYYPKTKQRGAWKLTKLIR